MIILIIFEIIYKYLKLKKKIPVPTSGFHKHIFHLGFLVLGSEN